MNNAKQSYDHLNVPKNVCNKRLSHKHIASNAILLCRGGDSSTPSSHQEATQQHVRPSLLVEFDTSIRRPPQGGLQQRFENSPMTNSLDTAASTLSLSLDASQFLHRDNTTTMLIQQPDDTYTTSKLPAGPQPHHLPLSTMWTLVSQSALLLPSLLLTRRILNSTSNAVVDYFRGRYLRTTFTRLERAYLRYYEFPAATRALFRVASQIGILTSLSWAMRWWMWMVLKSGGEDVTLSTFIDASSMPLEVSWDFQGDCLPCHRVGSGGIPWPCSVIWIGSVVAAGHACAMALSKWGGPLRLQAVSASQQPQKPTHMLSWIIHHPIQWIRGLDEWKHFSSISNLRRGSRRSRWRAFDPDPLLFPATWMPLRWLQIYAMAKAFGTDPEQYRWCSPEKQTTIVYRLMNIYLVQLALGDEWSRVFLAEYRVGLGIVAVSCYFVALAWMVFTTFTMNAGSSLMLLPSLMAAIISGFMNISIFWNRLGSREQKKALVAMGWNDKR